MSKLPINLNCCLCEATAEIAVEMPDGWEHPDDGTDEEEMFCPKHAPIKAFKESQCPGCVGGWCDCPMWRAFAYSERRNIRPDDYAALERGVCPRRINGTIGVHNGNIEDLDLSEQAPVEAGRAFAQAIREYCEKWPEKRRA